MRRIEAITFDAGGTLFSPREPVGATYARLAREAGIEAEVGPLETGFELAFGAATPLVAPIGATGSALLAAERAWWRDLVRATLGHALADGGAPLAPATFDRFFAATYAHYAAPDAWRLHEDALPCLEALRGRDVALGVLSNFDSRLHDLVGGLGLARAFRRVFASTELGSAKPDLAAFARAAEGLGARPGACLHVGDSFAADAVGAKRAGWTAVWLDRHGAAEPDRSLGIHRISSLTELPTRLDLDSL
jgi:putative hydrolase of the HAD superfamily